MFSSIAQSVEHAAVNRAVVGSSPTRGVEILLSSMILSKIFLNKRIRLLGQAVKTSPFHGGNTGSIPVGVIRFELFTAGRATYDSQKNLKYQYADVAHFKTIEEWKESSVGRAG